MKKTLVVFFILAAIWSNMLGCASDVAEWAKEDVQQMIDCGVVPDGMRDVSYTENITREQLADLLYRAYQVTAEEKYTPQVKKPFPDTTSIAAAALYELGILGGDENGKFAPARHVTRQEAAKMFCTFYGIINDRNILTADLKILHTFADEKQIGEWARKYVAILAEKSIMGDFGDGNFYPNDSMSVQQAIVIVSRLTDLKAPAQSAPRPIVSAENSDSDFLVQASWEKVSGVKEYTVTVTEWRDTVHGEEIGAKDPVVYTVSEPEITFVGEPNRRYVIEVSGGNFRQTIERYTPIAIPYQTRMEEMEQGGGLPENQEEAEALLQTITVNVWNLKNGKKVPSTAQLTVHRVIADKVWQVFQEIFEGEEQFPIYSVGAYAWRGGRSEHNWGTAIDINPTENYCIYTNGTVVGDYWKPYMDPHSITPYGEVVCTFEKYGFTWGGDEWSGNRDYMHFSYLGT